MPNNNDWEEFKKGFAGSSYKKPEKDSPKNVEEYKKQQWKKLKELFGKKDKEENGY